MKPWMSKNKVMLKLAVIMTSAKLKRKLTEHKFNTCLLIHFFFIITLKNYKVGAFRGIEETCHVKT